MAPSWPDFSSNDSIISHHYQYCYHIMFLSAHDATSYRRVAILASRSSHESAKKSSQASTAFHHGLSPVKHSYTKAWGRCIEPATSSPWTNIDLNAIQTVPRFVSHSAITRYSSTIASRALSCITGEKEHRYVLWTKSLDL